MAVYAGVDLGATNIRAIVADADGTVLGNARQATPQGPVGTAVADAVLDAIRAVALETNTDLASIEAVGVGAAGALDLAAGIVEPTNVPVDRVPLVGPVSNLVEADDHSIHLHNDTNAGCIGERFYADRNPDDMAYLTVSSGIGAGVCVDGKVLGGWDGNAGEVGHLVVDPEMRRPCGCGKAGHWEAYCSGNNIPRYAEDLFSGEIDGNATAEVPTETALPVDDEDFSAADVFSHAGEDDFADHVIGRVADWNAIGIANTVHAFAPLVIYVGGAVALNNPDLVLDPVRERLSEMVFINVPEIELTELGDDVVVRGALARALTGGTGDRRDFER
jgi:glucokinase